MNDEKLAYFQHMLSSRLSTLHPPVVVDIMLHAIRTHVVGLIDTPRIIEPTEFSVAVQPGATISPDNRIPNKLIFRGIFQAECVKLGRQFYLCTLSAREPGGGVIDGTTAMAPCDVYLWDDGSWHEVSTYVHPGVHAGWDQFSADDEGQTFPVPVEAEKLGLALSDTHFDIDVY